MQADEGAAPSSLSLPFRRDDEALGNAGICGKGAVHDFLMGDSDDGDIAVFLSPVFSHLAPTRAGNGTYRQHDTHDTVRSQHLIGQFNEV